MLTDIRQAGIIYISLTFRAIPDRRLTGKVRRFTILFLRLAEIEFQFEIVFFSVGNNFQNRGERPPHFGTETLQWPDFALLKQFLDFGNGKLATARCFRHGKFTFRTGKTTIVFLDFTTTFRTWGLQCRVIARNGIFVVFLGAFDDYLCHLGNLLP